jgi:arsenite methyltransferase
MDPSAEDPAATGVAEPGPDEALAEIRAEIATGIPLVGSLATRFYRAVHALDPAATEESLAVLPGNRGVQLYESPIAWAPVMAGERVLDLGCGSGGATRAAARVVGPEGMVVGVDSSPECIAEAQARTPADLPVLYRRGDAQHIANVPDRAFDCVVASLVLEQVADLARTAGEIFRVLRPGGRVCVADLVVDDDLPPEVLSSGAAWAGCIAGALSERVFVRKLERAGFVDIDMGDRTSLTLDDVALYPLFTPDVLSLMRRRIPDDAQQHIATSLIARARKPTAHTRGTPAAGPVASTVVRKLDDLSASADVEGVTVRLLKRVEDVELTVKDVEPGHATPLHTHAHAHQGLIVAGTGVLQLTGQRIPLTPGDVFSIAPNEPHAIGSEGPAPLRLVCLDCFVD